MLSEREREVVRYVAHGYSNKEIASKLDVSVKTVETYRFRATEKLGLNSRAELGALRDRSGLDGRRNRRRVSAMAGVVPVIEALHS